MNFKRVAGFLICTSVNLWLLTGCSSAPVVGTEIKNSNAAYEAARESLRKSDRVSPGNNLLIRYEGDAKVAGTYQVDFDGRVRLPYDVTVYVGGLTTDEVATRISAAYRPFVKGDHATKVELKDRNVWIEVHGEVKTPGRYQVRLDTPLEEIISLAGGYLSEQSGAVSSTVTQRPEYLRIERLKTWVPSGKTLERESSWYELAGYYYQYTSEAAFLWRGGERLYFQKTVPSDVNVTKNWHAVTIMGEVHEPKDLPILPNSDLMTYLSHSGGISTTADLTRIDIVHRSTGDKTTVDLTKDPLFNDIKAGDVITVRAIDTRPTTLDRIFSYGLTLSTITLSVVAIMLL